MSPRSPKPEDPLNPDSLSESDRRIAESLGDVIRGRLEEEDPLREFRDAIHRGELVVVSHRVESNDPNLVIEDMKVYYAELAPLSSEFVPPADTAAAKFVPSGDLGDLQGEFDRVGGVAGTRKLEVYNPNCQKGHPGCKCKIGWPPEEQCPDCREETKRDSYCICPPKETKKP